MSATELIRGLGLGGAETLLVARMEQSSSRASTTVVNTFPVQDHYRSALEKLGVNIVETSPKPLTSAVGVIRVAARCGDAAVLISHSPSIGAVLKARRLLGWGRGQVLVDVVHNSQFRPIYHWLGRLLNHRVDLAICVGDQVLDSKAAQFYPRKVVVHGGVDGKRMREWRASHASFREHVRSVAGALPDDLVLVSVGGLTQVKNQWLALEVMEDLGTGHRLIFVGDGPDRSRLQEHAVRARLPVTFVGRQEHGWRWIGAADAVLHTSRYEGLPVALMEAAALDVPIVATPFEGVREIRASGARIIISPDFSAESLSSALRCVPETSELLEPGNYWDSERFCRDFEQALEALGA